MNFVKSSEVYHSTDISGTPRQYQQLHVHNSFSESQQKTCSPQKQDLSTHRFVRSPSLSYSSQSMLGNSNQHNFNYQKLNGLRQSSLNNSLSFTSFTHLPDEFRAHPQTVKYQLGCHETGVGNKSFRNQQEEFGNSQLGFHSRIQHSGLEAKLSPPWTLDEQATRNEKWQLQESMLLDERQDFSDANYGNNLPHYMDSWNHSDNFQGKFHLLDPLGRPQFWPEISSASQFHEDIKDKSYIQGESRNMGSQFYPGFHNDPNYQQCSDSRQSQFHSQIKHSQLSVQPGSSSKGAEFHEMYNNSRPRNNRLQFQKVGGQQFRPGPYNGPSFLKGPQVSKCSFLQTQKGRPEKSSSSTVGFASSKYAASGDYTQSDGQNSVQTNRNITDTQSKLDTYSQQNKNSTAISSSASSDPRVQEASECSQKCIALENPNVYIGKLRRLAQEVKTLKSERPNAVDKLYSAANRAQVHIQCEIESGPIVRGTGIFFCLVQFDGINISVHSGLNKRTAKLEAFEHALKQIMKPHLRIVQIDGNAKELQASNAEFPDTPPTQTVVKPSLPIASSTALETSGPVVVAFQKESNKEAIISMKKRNYSTKELTDFVLVEPQDHNSSINGASILRRSADFSKMLLEYDFAAHGNCGAIRCIVRVEGQVLADIVAPSKPAAKIEASQRAVNMLRQKCWTILTKQLHDSNEPEITKEEIFSDFASTVGSHGTSSNSAIPDSNKGKKLLLKMGWTGGGIGKDGTGIEEPVSMQKIINREGLGLNAAKGITANFRQHVTELLEAYAASARQDDLVFSPLFRKDERIIIHNECRRLGLKSNSKGQGKERFLIVRRKRSAPQLLDHIMACGGETVRYKIVPPGQRIYPWQRIISNAPVAVSTGVS